MSIENRNGAEDSVAQPSMEAPRRFSRYVYYVIPAVVVLAAIGFLTYVFVHVNAQEAESAAIREELGLPHPSQFVSSGALLRTAQSKSLLSYIKELPGSVGVDGALNVVTADGGEVRFEVLKVDDSKLLQNPATNRAYVPVHGQLMLHDGPRAELAWLVVAPDEEGYECRYAVFKGEQGFDAYEYDASRKVFTYLVPFESADGSALGESEGSGGHSSWPFFGDSSESSSDKSSEASYSASPSSTGGPLTSPGMASPSHEVTSSPVAGNPELVVPSSVANGVVRPTSSVSGHSDGELVHGQ